MILSPQPPSKEKTVLWTFIYFWTFFEVRALRRSGFTTRVCIPSSLNYPSVTQTQWISFLLRWHRLCKDYNLVKTGRALTLAVPGRFNVAKVIYESSWISASPGTANSLVPNAAATVLSWSKVGSIHIYPCLGMMTLSLALTFLFCLI